MQHVAIADSYKKFILGHGKMEYLLAATFVIADDSYNIAEMSILSYQ